MGNCFNVIKKVIKKCDFFGTFITFRINDEIEYKLIIGGLTSIIFLILAILYTIYVGIPFIQRENIDFIFSNKIIETQPYINLTSTKFNFGFSIQYQDDATTATKDYIKYFNFSLKLKEWIGEDTIIIFPFGLKECEKSDFFNLVNESFDRIDYYKFFEIEIKLTEYGMNNLNELKNLMEKRRIEMAVYFLDTAIHYQNRNHPLPFYINYLTKGLDVNFEKTIQILISKIEFINDDNIFFKQEKTMINAAFDKIEESFAYIPSRKELNDDLIGKFIIKASSKVILLNRSYQKFPSFIADLAGILEELLLFILLLINIIERQAIDNKLIHKMLKMKGSKNHDIHYFLSHFEKIYNTIKKCSTKEIIIKSKNSKKNDDNEKLILRKSKINSKDNLNSKTLHPNSHIYHKLNNSNENPNQSELILYEKKYHLIRDQSSERNFNQKKKINNKNQDNKEEILNKFISNFPLKNNNIKNKQFTLNQSINKSGNQSNLNLNQDNINNLSKVLIRNKNNDENQAEKDFPSINIISAVLSYLCFWSSKYQKRRYELLRNAEKKIHYFLEIFNYIKSMQEIDLMKYCLFDKEEVILLDYLSYPLFKTSSYTINKTYKEFESLQIPYKKIQKQEIDEVYNCYNFIKNKEIVRKKDIKLLKLIDAENEILAK